MHKWIPLVIDALLSGPGETWSLNYFQMQALMKCRTSSGPPEDCVFSLGAR